MNIALSGDLGSGKSTVKEILLRKGFSDVSIGNIMRDMAKKANMSIEQFNQVANNNPNIDKEIDNKLIELGKKRTKAIFDSRLAWYFVPNSFKVYLTADINETAKRVFKANRQIESFNTIEDAKISLCNRRLLERERYYKEYNVDIMNMSNYDLILDSTYLKPDDVVSEIMKVYKQYESGNKIKVCKICTRRIYPTQNTRDLSEVTLNNYINENKRYKDYMLQPIKVCIIEGNYFVVDGHHRLLSALVNKIELISCILVNPIDIIKNRSMIYDFEEIGNFKYENYPY